MERVLSWAATLDRFYRILLAASLVTGVLGVLAGVGTGNPALVLIGLSWLLGGPVVVGVAARRETA